jgi:hypothetical protein
MGSSVSKPMGSSKRKHPEDHDNSQEARVRKQARIEPCDGPPVKDRMITVVVGDTEFQESLGYLYCNSSYIKNLYEMNPALDRVEFRSDPNHWKLVKLALKPFCETTVNQENYSILLPWFVALQCTEGLLAADKVIKNVLVAPLLAKAQSDRTKEDFTHVVTILGLCVNNNRDDPLTGCIRFLVQMLMDPSQPFEGEDVLRILHLLAKNEACQLTMWRRVKLYLPAAHAASASFPKELVNSVLGNNLLVDVIKANIKLRDYMYVHHRNELKGALATMEGTLATMESNNQVPVDEAEVQNADF